MTVWESVFRTTAYAPGLATKRAQVTYAVLGLLLLVAPLSGFFAIIVSPAASLFFIIALISIVIVWSSVGIVLVQRGAAHRVGFFTLAGLSVMWAVIAIASGDVLSGRMAIWPAVIILLSAVLLSIAELRSISLGVVVAFMGVSVYQSIVEGVIVLDMVLLAAYGLTVALTLVSLDIVRMSRQAGQAQATDVRDKLMTINRELIEQASQRATLDTALNTVIGLITENFDEIYHAQVFLLEAQKSQARLKASTGAIGQDLLERKHRLAVGSLSIIGQVTLRNEAIIARVDDPDVVHRPNDLLPETKLEAAFPLRIGTDVIGALDIQSKAPWDFTEYDQQLFQTLADSLSLVIDNIQQFARAHKSIQENQRLTEQANRAMFDVQRLNQRLIGRAWSEYLTGKDNEMGLLVDLEAETEEANADWTPGLAQASKQNLIIQEGHMLSVPLRVRGQVIGAMEFELDDALLTPEDLEMVQEISERFGLAAENTRLVEESQRVAQREALINEISSRLQASNNVEATLAETARSLSDTLQATRVVIKLGEPDEAADSIERQG